MERTKPIPGRDAASTQHVYQYRPPIPLTTLSCRPKRLLAEENANVQLFSLLQSPCLTTGDPVQMLVLLLFLSNVRYSNYVRLLYHSDYDRQRVDLHISRRHFDSLVDPNIVSIRLIIT